MDRDALAEMAKDLRIEYPSSPQKMLGGYVILARCLDKCRAYLIGTNGDYSFWPCTLCEELEAFTEIDHEKFKDFVATGATDEEVVEWVHAQSKVKDKMEIIRWNNKMRDRRLSEMPDTMQEFLESYISENLPEYHRPVYVWFDVFDIEERRM